MMLRTLAAAAALSLAFAGSAFADDSVSATLTSPLAKTVQFVAEGAVFNCASSSCIATDAPSRANTTIACKAVVKKVGPVTAFGAGSKLLSTESLAKCNAAAVTQTASR